MARKKGEPPYDYEFVRDLAPTPVVVQPIPSMAGTHLVPALGPMAPGDRQEPEFLPKGPQLDPPLTAEERELVKQLTGVPYVRFVWD